MILASSGIIASQIASFDADVLAFFARVTAAGGSLSNTEKVATNQLVLDLKANSLWTPMKAIYPMVGASAEACKQNLKSSSFTGKFTSGWTFASTGVTPNNAYMNTGLIPNVDLQLNSVHISSYIRTTNSAPQIFLGTDDYTLGRTGLLYMYNAGFSALNCPDQSSTSIAGQNGLFLNSRTSSTNLVTYKNATTLSTLTAVATQRSGTAIFVGGYNNNGTLANASNNQTAFVSIGDGLSPTQESNLYTAVQAFQTTLSRNV